MIRTALIHRYLRCYCAAFVMAAVPVSAQALDFAFPAPATQSFNHSVPFTSYALPVGPFRNGAMDTRVIEGAVSQTAWSFPAKSLTTLQILALLRDQLATAGYVTLFECETRACGGFDFRFGTDIAAEPAMHIDLGDFRYLAAQRDGQAGPDHIAVIVSRSSTLGFVQITKVGKALPTPQPVVSPAAPLADKPAETTNTTPLGDGLAKRGSVALDDLIFASSAADLEAGEYASLEALAAFLRANPGSKVVLVGHTDASGGLEGNIALSRERAASVRAVMINSYDIPPEQISADGVGYLAPRASNLTDQGRTRNRRVEVMLLVNPK